MKRVWGVFFISCAVFLSRGYSEIVEIAHFSEVESYVSPGSLLLVDIDDTLLVPKQMLGCDEWFMSQYNWYLQKGMDAREALERSLAEWEAIRHLSEMRIVEEGTEGLLSNWQTKGVALMGFTTQGLALATRTVLQLNQLGIDLSKTAPGQGDCFVDYLGHGTLYRKGIFFTSGTHKGESFFLLCEKLGISPKKIIFINDKKSHLRQVEEAAEKRGICFIGLRYGYSDGYKACYDPEIAKIQFFHSNFSSILSDDTAKKMREEKKEGVICH